MTENRGQMGALFFIFNRLSSDLCHLSMHIDPHCCSKPEKLDNTE
jgi:hypothetical protein